MGSQAPASPPPVGNKSSQYDFITNPVSSPKKSILLPDPSSKTGRIVLVLGGLIFLAIVAIIVSSLLGSSERALKSDLLKAVQQQTELIRISKIGTKEAVDTNARNLATNVNVILESSSDELIELAKKGGVRLDTKLTNGLKDTSTDTTLEEAKKINNFDEEFTSIIKTQLTDYQRTLQGIYQKAQNEDTKSALSELFDSATLLIGTD